MRLFGKKTPPPAAPAVPTLSLDTPPDVAKAMFEHRQKSKELELFADVHALLLLHDRTGLEKRRIAGVLLAVGNGIRKVGRP